MARALFRSVGRMYTSGGGCLCCVWKKQHIIIIINLGIGIMFHLQSPRTTILYDRVPITSHIFESHRGWMGCGWSARIVTCAPVCLLWALLLGSHSATLMAPNFTYCRQFNIIFDTEGTIIKGCTELNCGHSEVGVDMGENLYSNVITRRPHCHFDGVAEKIRTLGD